MLEPEPDLSVFIRPSAAPDPVDVPVPSTEKPGVASKSKVSKDQKAKKNYALSLINESAAPNPNAKSKKKPRQPISSDSDKDGGTVELSELGTAATGRCYRILVRCRGG